MIMSKIQTVKIADIKVDDAWNVRAHALSRNTIDEYVANIDYLPPVSVWNCNGDYYLVDGSHRMAAHLKAGRAEIRVNVVGATTGDDTAEAREFALLANLHSQFALTREQRVQVAKGLYLLHPEWTIAKLAERMGVCAQTASQWLADAQAAEAVGDTAKPIKREWVILLSKVESNFARCLTNLKPVAQWSPEELQLHEKRLRPIAELYSKVREQLGGK